MQVTNTGLGLAIFIKCRPILQHGWMSFASWYSISLNLPDAKVVVICEPGKPAPYFQWCSKFNIPFTQRNANPSFPGEKLKMPPTVMAVRQYMPDSLGPIPATSEDISTFVDFAGGVGPFVSANWIHNASPPFGRRNARLDSFGPNETKVLSIWQKCESIYSVV